MSRYSFGAVFGDGGVRRGGQELVCPADGNRTDWIGVVSDERQTTGMCGECGRTVTIRNGGR